MLHDDEIQEWRLRQRYPLLCERFLDGYTAAQVARGHGMSAEKLRIELDIELYAARRDPMTNSGAGKVLITMAKAVRLPALMELPEITEVQRFQYKPGDRFILHYDTGYLDAEQAREIVKRFREALKLPNDVPVAIMDQEWTVVITEPSGVEPNG